MRSILLAGLAAGDGSRNAAAQGLEEAQDGFEKISLHGYASAASYSSGVLRRDEKGLSQMRSAQRFFEDHDFKNPIAFIRMLIPGNWV